MSLFFLALLSGFASLLFDFENNSWPTNCIFVNTPAPHRIPHVYTKRVKGVKMKGLNEWKEKRRPSVSWLQKNKVSTLFNRVLNVFTLNKSAPGIIVTNSKNKKPHTVPYFKKERKKIFCAFCAFHFFAICLSSHRCIFPDTFNSLPCLEHTWCYK